MLESTLADLCLYGRGKSVRNGTFYFGQESQGKSGKLAHIRGKIAFSFFVSGKNSIFYHHRSFYVCQLTFKVCPLLSFMLNFEG